MGNRLHGIASIEPERRCPAGNPAIVGINPVDRWLCVPGFRQVYRSQRMHYVTNFVSKQQIVTVDMSRCEVIGIFG